MSEVADLKTIPDLHVYFVVGEPSGDQLAAHLMEALKEKTAGKVQFSGLGADRMAAQGLTSLFPINDFAVMGFDYIPKLRTILRRIRQIVDDIKDKRPDCVVLVDAQSLSYQVGRRLGSTSIPLIQYVAPTVWAWRKGRAKMVSQYLNHILSVFPFEAPYFAPYGLPVTFVGHPAAEASQLGPDAGKSLCERFHIPERATVISVLPGSRRNEVSRHIPLYLAALKRLSGDVENIVCLVPTVSNVANLVEEGMADWPWPVHILRDSADKHAAFRASAIALAASGTVTLETAFAGLPTVIAYELKWYAEMVGRIIMKTPFVGGVNIVMGREVMPEHVFGKDKVGRLYRNMLKLLTDPKAREDQLTGIDEAVRQLSVHGDPPSYHAAETILRIAAENSSKTIQEK